MKGLLFKAYRRRRYREHTENRVLFLTTIARKDLLTPIEEEPKTAKGEEESRDLILPENVEAVTQFLSSIMTSFCEHFRDFKWETGFC